MPLSKQFGLSRGWPVAPGLGPINPNKGGGVIYDFTVIALGRVIGPETRFIDTRS